MKKKSLIVAPFVILLTVPCLFAAENSSAGVLDSLEKIKSTQSDMRKMNSDLKIMSHPQRLFSKAELIKISRDADKYKKQTPAMTLPSALLQSAQLDSIRGMRSVKLPPTTGSSSASLKQSHQDLTHLQANPELSRTKQLSGFKALPVTSPTPQPKKASASDWFEQAFKPRPKKS